MKKPKYKKGDMILVQAISQVLFSGTGFHRAHRLRFRLDFPTIYKIKNVAAPNSNFIYAADFHYTDPANTYVPPNINFSEVDGEDYIFIGNNLSEKEIINILKLYNIK
jgi:hypothetical protein